MTAIKQIEDALRAIGVSRLIIRTLPERPNYNGSVLLIDDDEAERISEDLDDAAKNMREVMAHIAAQDAEIARLRETLNGIANADIRKWEQGYQTTDEFMSWAQSRATAALATTSKGAA